MALPEDWQEQIHKAVTKIRTNDPTKQLFGIALPEDWKSSLREAWSSGQLKNIANVRSVTFAGNAIVGFEKDKCPVPTVAAPTKSKSK